MRRACHRPGLAARVAGLCVLALVLVGCAPRAGWVLTTGRVCQRRDEPQICMSAAPDQPLSARVGDVRIVPGECVRAPDGTRGHAVRVVITDGRGMERSRLLWASRGRRTYLEVGGRMRVRRRGCDQRLPTDDSF